MHSRPQPADIFGGSKWFSRSKWFSGGQNGCNFLLYLMTKHVFENFVGREGQLPGMHLHIYLCFQITTFKMQMMKQSLMRHAYLAFGNWPMHSYVQFYQFRNFECSTFCNCPRQLSCDVQLAVGFVDNDVAIYFCDVTFVNLHFNSSWRDCLFQIKHDVS